MKGSGKRRLVKKYVSDFIFSEKMHFILDGTQYKISNDNPDSRFIKFTFEGSKKTSKKYVFRCIYKMMKKFTYSLN
ncbi:hypothetical protein [Gramella sp. AN32]|uniref:Transposase n=1 Tax=Christiangramia antarctica TaxID=2058158 RepID=A0ABW5X3W6_9FLAO|nr:hypothetical protein [Gramella sp. AN32]MCM4156360.1 hypothetical protein [Gramella sp. AN32]